MHSSRLQKNKVVIFIPFSFKENNQPLLAQALEWQKQCQSANKKVPEIIVYSDKDETGSEYQTPIHTQFSEKNVPKYSTIYLLSHGTNNPHWVANTNSNQDEYYKLPIELVAKRAKAMGLTPELAYSISSFRLYICEESTQADRSTTKSLAIHFARELGS